MFAPVHGVWCATRTWPTRCPTCRASVFFFSCDCGSRVFFDQLGPPWPTHDCDTSWTRGLKRSVGPSGALTVQISDGVAVTRLPDSFRVEDSIVSRAKRRRGDNWGDPIRSVDAARGAKRWAVGLLRELARTAKPIKALGFPDTAMGRAMLGPIGKQPVGRITVHIPPVDDGPIESITAWIPAELVRAPRIERHVSVSVRAESVSVGPQRHAWFCNYFEVLG